MQQDPFEPRGTLVTFLVCYLDGYVFKQMAQNREEMKVQLFSENKK